MREKIWFTVKPNKIRVGAEDAQSDGNGIDATRSSNG